MNERIHRPSNDNNDWSRKKNQYNREPRRNPDYSYVGNNLSIEELDEEDELHFNMVGLSQYNDEYKPRFKNQILANYSDVAEPSSTEKRANHLDPIESKVSDKTNEKLDTNKQVESTKTKESEVLNVGELSSTEKLGEAMKWAAFKLPLALEEQLLAMISPASLATMVGVLGAYAASHAVGIGVIADAVMLIGGGALVGWQIVAAAKDFWGFAQFVNAETEADLDKAGQHLADFIVTVGLDILLAILAKKAAGKAKNYGDDLNRVDEVSAHSDNVGSLDNADNVNAGQVNNVDNINQDNFDVYPSTPVGRRGNHIQVPPPANIRRTIGGREFSGHALDRMQEQGILPSAVENAIQNGEKSPARNDAERFYDKTNNITVIVDKNSGLIITTDFGNFDK